MHMNIYTYMHIMRIYRIYRVNMYNVILSHCSENVLLLPPPCVLVVARMHHQFHHRLQLESHYGSMAVDFEDRTTQHVSS